MRSQLEQLPRLHERKGKLADRIAKLKADNKRRTAHNDLLIAGLLQRSTKLDLRLDTHCKENVRRIQARIKAGQIPPNALRDEIDRFAIDIFLCPKTAKLDHDLRLTQLAGGQ